MLVNPAAALWLWQFQSGHEEGGEPPLEVGQEGGEVIGVMGGGGGGGDGAAAGTGGEEPHLAGDQLFEVACKWKAGTCRE